MTMLRNYKTTATKKDVTDQFQTLNQVLTPRLQIPSICKNSITIQSVNKPLHDQGASICDMSI